MKISNPLLRNTNYFFFFFSNSFKLTTMDCEDFYPKTDKIWNNRNFS